MTLTSEAVVRIRVADAIEDLIERIDRVLDWQLSDDDWHALHDRIFDVIHDQHTFGRDSA